MSLRAAADDAHGTPTSMPTAEQETVIGAPPDARTLVTAGPGTGKTFVLVARLGELIDVCGLQPGSDILVLSFTRAAVAAVRDTASIAKHQGRFASVYTFDSFASRLLGHLDPDGDWAHESYDERINRAAELVRTPLGASVLASIRHVIVDEMQDLVAERAEFVKALLTAVPHGFTLLGDPAQGIYNWSLQGEARRVGSAALYRWVRDTYADTLRDVRLTQNHRALSEPARRALWVGARFDVPDPDYPAIARELQALVWTLPTLGSVENAVPTLARSLSATAVLCRNNGQALVVSRALRRQGTPHSVRRPSADHVAPNWIAQALHGLEIPILGRTDFRARLERIPGPDRPTSDACWALLKRIDDRPTDNLDVRRVAARLRTRSIPDELAATPSDGLVVSTIHRAKGLEFDCVVLVVDDGRAQTDPAEAAEESRVLYVGLTRPRRTLYTMLLPHMNGTLRRIDAAGRWVLRRGGWKTGGVEICGDDADPLHPAGSYLLPDCDVPDIQRYLAEDVRRGDPVSLILLAGEHSDAPYKAYGIQHAGRWIGVTSMECARALHASLSVRAGWQVLWPNRIDDVFIDGVDSVAGSDGAGGKYGFGLADIWLRARVSGLGTPSFPKTQG